MIGIILGLIVIVGIIFRSWDSWDLEGTVFGVFGGILIGAVVAVFTNIFMALFVDTVVVNTERSNLAALNDGTSTSGSFFLGSGSIDEEPSFMFYKEEGSGYLLETLPAREAKVFEDSEQAYMLKVTTGSSNNWISFFAGDTEYEFHVPENSVKTNIILDAS